MAARRFGALEVRVAVIEFGSSVRFDRGWRVLVRLSLSPKYQSGFAGDGCRSYGALRRAGRAAIATGQLIGSHPAPPGQSLLVKSHDDLVMLLHDETDNLLVARRVPHVREPVSRPVASRRA